MEEPIRLSVVIPTHNRLDSLQRTIKALISQDYLPYEIIIVDSSDNPILAERINVSTEIGIYILREEIPSVCTQRNRGILRAKGNYIFLCDDDIELQQDYLSILVEYCRSNPDEIIVTGSVLQIDVEGNWYNQMSTPSMLKFLWSFTFMQSLWFDRDEIKSNQNLINRILRLDMYERNRVSLAGWPIMTNYEGDFIKCTICGLGAAMIRSHWLKNHQYDEVLDPNGIGDNYGVAIQLPKGKRITIAKKAKAYHHKESLNRLPTDLAYYRRTLALHYFLKRNDRFSWMNILFYKWSVLGKLIQAIVQCNKSMMLYNMKILYLTSLGQNPYWIGHKNGKNRLKPH